MRRIVYLTVEIEFEETVAKGEVGLEKQEFADTVAFNVFSELERARDTSMLTPYDNTLVDTETVTVKMSVASSSKSYTWEHWDIRPLAHSKQSADKEVDPTPTSE